MERASGACKDHAPTKRPAQMKRSRDSLIMFVLKFGEFCITRLFDMIMSSGSTFRAQSRQNSSTDLKATKHFKTPLVYAGPKATTRKPLLMDF